MNASRFERLCVPVKPADCASQVARYSPNNSQIYQETFMQKRITFVLTFMLLLGLVLPGVISAAPVAQDAGLPQATLVNDEGGPTRLVGSVDYADFGIQIALQDPSPALLDFANVVEDDPTQFAPLESQILGHMTSPVAPSPLRYAFSLPIEPTATLLDVDNDGEEDDGVQIFYLAVGANLNGGSYLEQLDQWADLKSYLTDPVSGELTAGSLLVYAPDAEQGFPSDFGDDGMLFTADDPAVGLPAGYTVVHFGPDGFTFDRAAEAELNALEEAAAASPDFSDQGIVESFTSLIDHLAVRYSFTELRNLDWEAIRAEYLPQVEEAEQIASQNADAGAAVYATILHRLAQSTHDAHVASAIADPTYVAAATIAAGLQGQPIATNLGANTVALSDGRIIVSEVISGSPAAAAGWTLGTEIVAVNGTPVAEYLPTVIYNQSTGTAEGQHLFQVTNLLKFPAAEGASPVAEVTIDAILLDATAAESFTLTPGAYALPDRVGRAPRAMPIAYRMESGLGYLTWDSFHAPEVYMAVLEQFLTDAKSANGVILDLRGNSGGWDRLYFTMASYFFNADAPVSMHWIDQDVYDPAVGDLVREIAPEYLLSAPQADLYYGGPVVILIDHNCASSCEFFSQLLQKSGRATVVAEHGSKGAGAPINSVDLPFGIIFHYTKGRAYFAGTDEMNLEGKGVTPDVRVPVTLETVAAELQGGDPVLDEGRHVLNNLAGQAIVDSLTLVATDVITAFTTIYPDGWTPAIQGTQAVYTAPNRQYLLVYGAGPAQDVAALLATQGISDPAAALVATRDANGLAWSIYSTVDANNFAYRIAVAEANDMLYSITMATPSTVVEPLTEGLLYPVIDAFVPSAE